MRLSAALVLTLTGLSPATVMGAAITAQRLLPSGTIVSREDIALDLRIDGGIDDPDQAVGRQLRTTIQAGQMIHANSLTAPVLVRRNQLVTLTFKQGGLIITDQGRALDQGAAGEAIRILNTTSRATITGQVMEDGSVIVSSQP